VSCAAVVKYRNSQIRRSNMLRVVGCIDNSVSDGRRLLWAP